jgi:hypothetical protein
MLRLFLDTDRLASAIELDNTIPLRFPNPVCKNRSTTAARDGPPEDLRYAVAEEDIISKYQAAGIPTYEIAPNNESLGDAARLTLDSVRQPKSPPRSVTKQRLVPLLILWGCDYQYLPYPGKHQCSQRIINHRLIVDWQQMFVYT